MKLSYLKSFEKATSKIRDKKLALAIYFAIQSVKQASNLAEIPNLKKLKGFSNAYRLRVGDYRIGMLIENDTVFLSAFDHRKDIYKKFP